MPIIVDFERDSEQDLAHYGVLGMKWGVRRYQNKDGTLTKAGQKRYENRESAIKSAKSTIDYIKKEDTYARRALSDIDTKGTNSKYVRNLYENDPNFQEGIIDLDKKRGTGFWDEDEGSMIPYNKLDSSEKKQILESAREHYSFDLDKGQTKQQQNIINNIKNTPINKKSYAEALSKDRKVSTGYAIAGAVLPVIGSVALSKARGKSNGKAAISALKTTVLISPWTGLAGAISSPDISGNYYKKYIDSTSRPDNKRRRSDV